MHGSITVTAAAGGGSLFQVELPLEPPGDVVLHKEVSPTRVLQKPVLNTALAELTPPEEAAPTDRAPAGAARILVVEDNPDMRRFICDALGAEFRVVAAADGEAALEVARACPPDLLVTDLMMPRLGGDRLVDALHATPALKDLPVLVLSAQGRCGPAGAPARQRCAGLRDQAVFRAGTARACAQPGHYEAGARRSAARAAVAKQRPGRTDPQPDREPARPAGLRAPLGGRSTSTRRWASP